MASDFVILILPLVAIWRLNIPMRRKLGVAAVFATGLFACMASVCRLAFTLKIFHDPDISYAILQTGLWTYVPLPFCPFSPWTII